MTPKPAGPRAVVDKAKDALSKVRPGPTEGRRAYPIRGTEDEINAHWGLPASQQAILEGIPSKSASIAIGPEDRDWGRTVTLTLELEQPVPGVAAQVLAGKAVKRLKALTETGELPTTDRNPSARPDAGEPA